MRYVTVKASEWKSEEPDGSAGDVLIDLGKEFPKRALAAGFLPAEIDLASISAYVVWRHFSGRDLVGLWLQGDKLRHAIRSAFELGDWHELTYREKTETFDMRMVDLMFPDLPKAVPVRHEVPRVLIPRRRSVRIKTEESDFHEDVREEFFGPDAAE